MAANPANGEGQSECRDFVRGVCNRGSSCKFFHSPNAGGMNQSETKLPICKDFQNKGCERNKCKFLHITQKEEEDYNMTGILPDHGGRPEKVKALGIAGGRAAGGPGSFPPADVCKDFLNGICQRGSRCKFRHITEQQYQSEMGGPRGGMYGKRRRDDFGGPGGDMMPFQEENEMLRRKISDLQRQVVDLRQMNDTLYEQNTRYRNQLRLSQPAGTTTHPPVAPDPYSASRVAYPTAATGGTDQLQSYDGYSKF